MAYSAPRAAARRSGSSGRRPSRARVAGPDLAGQPRGRRLDRSRRGHGQVRTGAARSPRRALTRRRRSCRDPGRPRCRRSRRRRPPPGPPRTPRGGPPSDGTSAARRRPRPAGPAPAGGRPRASPGSRSGGGRSRRTPTTPPASPFRSRRRPTPGNEASPSTIASASRPAVMRRGRDPEGVGRVVPARPSAAGPVTAPRSGSRPWISSGRGFGSTPRRPGRARPVAGPTRGPELARRCPGRSSPRRWAGASTRAVATICPGQSRRPAASWRDAVVGDVGDERRRRRPRRSAARGAASASKAAITAARSAKTSGWSHSADVTIAIAGRYASKLPAYSSASTTKAGPLPHRAVALTPPVSSDGSSAPTNADGSRPGPDQDVDQPAGRSCSCRGCPATPISILPVAASATTCCHGSMAIPADRAARSSGWSVRSR